MSVIFSKFPKTDYVSSTLYGTHIIINVFMFYPSQIGSFLNSETLIFSKMSQVDAQVLGSKPGGTVRGALCPRLSVKVQFKGNL